MLAAYRAHRRRPAVRRPARLSTASAWRGTSGGSPTRPPGASSSCSRRSAATPAGRPGGWPRWPRIRGASCAASRPRRPGATPTARDCASGTSFARMLRRCDADLGPGARVQATFERPVRWPRRACGAMGPAQAVPGLSQYWHPHLLGAAVRGERARRRRDQRPRRARAPTPRRTGARAGCPTRGGGARPTASSARTSASPSPAGRARLGPPADHRRRRSSSPSAARCCGSCARSAAARHRRRPRLAPARPHGAPRGRGRGPRRRRAAPAPGARAARASRAARLRRPSTSPATLRVRVRRRGRTVLDETSALAGLERGRGHGP